MNHSAPNCVSKEAWCAHPPEIRTQQARPGRVPIVRVRAVFFLHRPQKNAIGEIGHGFTRKSRRDKLLGMTQNHPPWMAEGIFNILCLALFVAVMRGLKWALDPIAHWGAGIMGLSTYPFILAVGCAIIGIAAYRDWRLGLLPYQRRRTEHLHREMGFPSREWPY